MAKMEPVGSKVADTRRLRSSRSPEYAAEQQRLAQFEELARLVIKHRASLGISQQQLAERVGTSHSAISRLESGRHRVSVHTLQRVANALGVRLLIGFESGPRTRPVREFANSSR
ncbi:MAG: XRE family transcriptional regulator [Acidobacteria bacterium]|nr:MAG: XRE family transcriptional regulator [Acidobacteriota bacterium]